MSVIHLSDNDIQEYLDTMCNKEKVENHILECEECAILLAEYQSFYTSISTEESPHLSVDFISQTMGLVRQEKIAMENNKGYYLYSIVSLLGIVAFLKYYIGFNFYVFKLDYSGMNTMLSDFTIFNTASQIYQTSTNTVNMLLFAGFIMLFFALIDSVMSRRSLNKFSSLSI